jgi:hypothetical protein
LGGQFQQESCFKITKTRKFETAKSNSRKGQVELGDRSIWMLRSNFVHDIGKPGGTGLSHRVSPARRERREEVVIARGGSRKHIATYRATSTCRLTRRFGV